MSVQAAVCCGRPVTPVQQRTIAQPGNGLLNSILPSRTWTRTRAYHRVSSLVFEHHFSYLSTTWLTVQAIRVLLRAGAKLGVPDGHGMTELHIAADADHPEVHLIYAHWLNFDDTSVHRPMAAPHEASRHACWKSVT